MKRFGKALAMLILFAACAHAAAGATISGAVKAAASAPLRGAFVHAKNLQTKISVNVLSDSQGRYQIQNLPDGEYDVGVSAVGYESDARRGVKLSAGESSSLDFTLQQGTVRWSDLSMHQGKKLLPDGQGKDIIAANCFNCHGFETRMAAVRRDLAGWREAVNSMRVKMHARLANHINDQEAQVVISYLNDAFGVDSILPKSPAEMPGYKATVRPFSDEALKIVYVEYNMLGPDRMPFSAAPDKDGKFWIPEMGSANHIGRLDPKTGVVEEFSAPIENCII